MSGTPSWSASAVSSTWIRRYAALRLNNTNGSQYTCDNGADEHADLDVVPRRGAVSERKFTD